MLKKVCISIAPLLLVSAAPAMAEPVTSKFNLSIGGYVKLDYAHNTNASGPTTMPAGASATNKKKESIFTAKQSRFWLRVAGPEFLGAKTAALVEADFYGNSSLSNEFGNMRMRHAYGSLDWQNTQVLFGQFWDVFGPAAADTIDFRQGGDTGAPNSPRVPQIRLTHKLNFNDNHGLKFVAAVQNPVQNTPVAQSNAFPTAAGNDGGQMVNVAGQIMYSNKFLGVSPGFMGLGMSPMQVGLFGLYGNEKVTGSGHVDNWGYGVYAFVPILKSSDGKSRAMTMSLEGQGILAAGMNVQNATSIALVGPATDRHPAKGYNVFGQLKFYPTQELGVTAGYGRRGAMNSDEYRTAAGAGTFQQYNQLAYTNLTYDLNSAVRVATEFEHHTTQYDRVVAPATSDKGQNNVFRVAAYYFF